VSSAKPHIRRAVGAAFVGVILSFMPADASAQHALAAQARCSGEKPQATFDQYCESVPTTTGERGSGDDPGDSPPPVRSIPGPTAHRLGEAPLGRAILPDAAVELDQPSSGDGTVAKRNRAFRPTVSGAPDGATSRRATPRTQRQSGAFHPSAALRGVPLALIALVVGLLGIAVATSLWRARAGDRP
jgi:hypothetical protein